MYDNKGFSQPPTVAGISSGGNATANESSKTRLQDYPDGDCDCATAILAEPAYKTRFREEYRQLKERYEKLKTFNNKIEAAMADSRLEMPKHDCPDWMLKNQQRVMGEYLHILEVRAVIEGVEL